MNVDNSRVVYTKTLEDFSDTALVSHGMVIKLPTGFLDSRLVRSVERLLSEEGVIIRLHKCTKSLGSNKGGLKKKKTDDCFNSILLLI